MSSDDDKFERYQRNDVAELRPYEAGDDLDRVSVSTANREAGSPKPGDMIARNPKNHADRWLVAKQYFKDNFKPMNEAFKAGTVAALARFKMSNMQMGAAGYNPTLNGQSVGAAMSPPSMKPPASPSPPMAAGAAKSKVLG